MTVEHDGDKMAEETSHLHIIDSREESTVRYHDRSSGSRRIVNNETTAQNITAKFRSAASSLKTGQLVKDAYFTLFEAVGALEIMDPKMDSGYLAPGETLDDDYDVLRHLEPEEVIGIMDQLICFEMAWHKGHPLSQSLFTSSYIDKLLWPEPKVLREASFIRDGRTASENQLLHLVLRGYCLALLKTCDFVLGTIVKEHYYEEEDFVSNLYHRNLLSNFEAADIESLLEDSIAYIGREELKTREIRTALASRLEFRKAFLLAVKPKVILHGLDPSTLWDSCLQLLPKLLSTKNLGVAVNTSFSSKIQRRLASSVPPRPIVEIGFDESYLYLTQLCQNGKEVHRVSNHPDGGDWMNFVMSFQSRTPLPSVYIRCLLQSLIEDEVRNEGVTSIKRFVFNDLGQIVLPANMLIDPANDLVEAPHDPRFQIARKMEAFVLRAAEFYLEIFRALCMNRSRMRRMLCHLILDWDGLQLDAEVLDIELRFNTKEEPMRQTATANEEMWSFPLSSWAYYHKLHQMEWIVQLGFELDIYQPDELGGMYWYLQHLASTRLQHLERIRMFTTRAFRRFSKPSSKTSAAFSRSFSFLDFAVLEASAIQSFADGLSCLYSCLTYLNLLPSSFQPFPYSTQSLRYSLRMRPFLPLSLPEVPSYPEFSSLVSLRTPETTDVQDCNASKDEIKEQALSILDVADQAMKAARKEWDAISKTDPQTARCLGCEDWWKASVRNVVRGCIAGNIAVATAKKGLMAPSGNDRNITDVLRVELPEKEKRYHAWWIVPSISVQ